jgi:hypothetical protein
LKTIQIFYSIAIPLVLATGVFAQENPSGPVFDVPQLEAQPLPRLDFGFQAGTSVWMYGRRNGLFSSYFAPEVRFHTSPRFRVNTGIMYSQVFLPGPAEGMINNRINSFTFFAEGQYQLNDRVSFSGMVLKELDPGLDPGINSFYRNTGMQAVGMGVQYKLTDHIRFGAGIRVSEGYPMHRLNSYYRDNPFGVPSRFGTYPWW